MKKISIILILFLSYCGSEKLLKPTKKEQVTLGITAMTFYLNPSKVKLNFILTYINRYGINNKQVWPMMGFLYGAAKKYGNKYITSRLNYSKKNQIAVRLFIDSIKYRERTLQKINNRAELNDLYWGIFFATGAEEIIVKLLNIANRSVENSDYGKFASIMTARWSLCSNARRYEAIKEVLSEYVNKKEYNRIVIKILTKRPYYFVKIIRKRQALEH